MKRGKTNAERAKESDLTPLLVNEEEAARILGFSVQTLQGWRTKTPERWTVETMEAAAKRGEPFYPPFRKLGKTKRAPVRYEVEALRKWVKLLYEWGRLPEEMKAS
jgi:hypothetical protein